MRGARREIKVTTATLGIETRGNCYRFEQCRFSRAVLADKERHRLLEMDLVEIADRRDAERVLIERRNPVAPQARLDQKIPRPPRGLSSHGKTYGVTVTPASASAAISSGE